MKKQFEKLTATEIYCPKCMRLSPVRERLLLVIPSGEIYDYRCRVCGSSLGSRQVTERDRRVMPVKL
jgi:hypothetical protein